MKVLRITLLYLKKLFSNKKVVVLNLLVPILFLSMILTTAGSGTTTSQIKLGVLNKDSGQKGDKLLKNIKNLSGTSIEKVEEKRINTLLSLGEFDFVIEIPENFSANIALKKDVKVDIKKTSVSNSVISLENTISSLINEIVTGDISGKIDSRVISKNSTHKDSSSEFILGIVIMVLMFSMTYVIGEIIDEKEEGTFSRVLSTPNSNIKVEAGFLLCFLIFGLIQCLSIILVSSFVFNTYWGNSYFSLFLLFFSFEVMLISLALFFSSVIKNGENMIVIMVAIITPTSMLGGCFFPAEMFTENVRKFSYLMPQTWILTGLKELAVKGNGIESIALNCGVMLLIGGVFFIAGARSLTLKIRN